MKLKRVLTTLLVSSIFCTTYAQSEHFLGFRTGMNFSKFQSDEFATSLKPGVLIGLSYRWKFDAAWSMNMDVIYGARGANHNITTYSSAGTPPNYLAIENKNDFRTKLTYIDVPIVFAYRVPVGGKGNIAPYYNTDPPASFNVFGGVNTGYLFKAGQSGTINQVTTTYQSDTVFDTETERILIDSELDSGFMQIDIQPTIGIGMLFNTGQGRRLYIDVRYSWSMLSINDGIYTNTASDGSPIIYDIRNRNLQVTFGMLFSTRKRVR